MPERREAALLSLSDTTGAVDLARALVARGNEIIATSGTRAFLECNGIQARDVESITGAGPLFGGRVKTLHPALFGAILFDRDNAAHRSEAERLGIGGISTVAVRLYPPPEIDIGGVALLRAAAKNYAHVNVLCDPEQYPAFVASLENGGPTLDERRALAAAALGHVSEYDRKNAEYITGHRERGERSRGTVTQLRYGENPHQRATFERGEIALPEQLHGKALSYNNMLDLDAALRMLATDRAVVVKHTIPCGVAERRNAAEAVRLALDADRTSAYGGILALAAPVDGRAAAEMAQVFLEIVAAPSFDEQALATLGRKRQLRIMRFAPDLPQRLQRERSLRSALGGVLEQTPDAGARPEELRVVSKRHPNDEEWRDLRFAWDVVRYVKSNGIVIAKDAVTSGICAGQTNRVSAVEIAGMRAGGRARGAACASDGFFPFKDGIEAAIAAGCTAIIAPGGSIRDAEVIAASDAANATLVFSSYRSFLH